MKSLFNEDDSLTPEARRIKTEMFSALEPIILKYSIHGYSARELASLACEIADYCKSDIKLRQSLSKRKTQ